MQNNYTPDLECKALYWKGPNKQYVLVEYPDGSAGLYSQGQKIAGFASLTAGYKGWLRAVRRWQKAKDPAKFAEWLEIQAKAKDPEKLDEWVQGYDLDPGDCYPSREAEVRLRRKLYEEALANVPNQDLLDFDAYYYDA
jgi:hypothetical protein